ncbi:MAG: hypothetical protein VYC34_04645, partial [Planctomycetota bacterium]|nr:hypothetical protein [Planctomycetota bacterium]
MADPGFDQTGEGEILEFDRLDAVLRGALPCIGCGYELRGLSVRHQCPECGLAVRATILYAVDPHAEAFQPMSRPRLIAYAAVAASAFALLAAVSAWTLRIVDMLQRGGALGPVTRDLSAAPPILALLAGVACAIAFIRPAPHLPPRNVVMATIGCLLVIPLAGAMWLLHAHFDLVHAAPYLVAEPQEERIGMRLLIGGLTIAALMLVRPNARQLVARSLVLRTGRVDRQTLAATAGSVVVAMMGDFVRLGSGSLSGSFASLVEKAGTALVAMGSLLVTLALA